MFFCAYLIDRSAKEYHFRPEYPSKIYWLQPGRQQFGDHVFRAFLAVSEGPRSSMTKKMQYIKFTRSKSRRKCMGIYPTLLFTTLGFVMQFIGLRGLHSSIMMAQMALTIVMAIVLTCLRRERMAPDENILSKEDREFSPRPRRNWTTLLFISRVSSLSTCSRLRRRHQQSSENHQI